MELIRFKEYYGMPRGHEQDPLYSLSIRNKKKELCNELMPPGHPIILLKSNLFNMAPYL